MARIVLALLVGVFTLAVSEDCSSQRKLQRASSDVNAVGYYEVQCNPDNENEYVSKQCWASTGRCWCVDKFGKTIPGSHVNPGQDPIDCATFGHCAAAREELLKNYSEMPPMGAYVPQCDEYGNYAVTQRYGSTGQSWCATINGNRVPGTVTGPTQQSWDCENLPACLAKEASLAHLMVENIYPFGLDTPECDGQGKFRPTQCHGSTGHCWCVDPESGEEIEGTRKGPGEGETQCDEAKEQDTFDEATATSCQKLFNIQMAYLEDQEFPLFGFWTVECEEDGSFAASQCHPSTGRCWCVDENGTEIPGSRSSPSSPRVPCLKKQPSCSEKKEKIDQEFMDNFFIGMYSPECDEDGSYKSKQCWGSTGQCWCVTKDTGKEIVYTRRGPTEKPNELDCSGTTPPGPPPMRLETTLNDEGSEAEPVKGANTSLFVIIAVLAGLLIVVLIAGVLFYRRSKNAGANYRSVQDENPSL